MDRMTAFCGIICTNCKAFIATRENSDTKRKEVAEEWSKELRVTIKPNEINCDGCLSREGQHTSYCSTCEIRKCGIKKNVENCACCPDYYCGKLPRFHEWAPSGMKAKNTLEEIRKQTHVARKRKQRKQSAQLR